jgi:phage virion morphogenesis protein
MADELNKLHEYANGILTQLNNSNRTKLAREIAKKLRESNRKRITAQKQPNGTSFEPRRPQAFRKKTGKIRHKMFTKLRTTKYLRISANSNCATVKFINSVSRITHIHHYGLRARVNKKDDWTIKYPSRKLLGFNQHDYNIIEQITIAHLASKL